MRRISCSITARSSAGSPRASASRRFTWTSPLIEVSGLRSSWATPAATWPMAAICSARTICRSRSRSSCRCRSIAVATTFATAWTKWTSASGNRRAAGRVDAQDAERAGLAVEGDGQAADDPVLAGHGRGREAGVGAEVLDEDRHLVEDHLAGRGARPQFHRRAAHEPLPPADPGAEDRPCRPGAVPGGCRTRPRGPRRARARPRPSAGRGRCRSGPAARVRPPGPAGGRGRGAPPPPASARSRRGGRGPPAPRAFVRAARDRLHRELLPVRPPQDEFAGRSGPAARSAASAPPGRGR